MKFSKKPVVIDAFQLTLETRWDNKDWPEWLNEAWNKDRNVVGAVYPASEDGRSDDLRVYTLEGSMLARIDDWIIRGVKGEVYPCKPDIFKATYDVYKEPEKKVVAEVKNAEQDTKAS